MADIVKVLIGEKNSVELEFTEEYLLISENIPYNNTDSGLIATDVKTAIDEVANTVATSASPGFSYGRSGNTSSGTYLQNEGVPSNRAGRYIYIQNANIERLFISNESISTFTIQIYSHDGDEVNLTLLSSHTVTTSRGGDFIVNVPVATGKQLALFLSAGSAKNIVAGLELSGSN